MIGAGAPRGAARSASQVWLVVASYGRLWLGCGWLWPTAAGCGAAAAGRVAVELG
jgi:hypothetical protein